MLFADLNLAEPILRALQSEKYDTATPIQAQAIPHILEGKDVMGSAQTGTGKTAAFALPILHRLLANPPQTNVTKRKPRVLVLSPTRELATQIATGFKTYGQGIRWIRYSVVFGGVSQQGQVSSLTSGVDIVIACPGRLLDLMNQGYCDLSNVDTLVLDEADRMLDMGFIHDIRRITSKIPSAKRQTLMFSATMPPEIRKLANTILRDPVSVAVAPVSQVADRISESVYFVEKARKAHLLAHLVKELPMYRTIVFTRTKHGADKVVKKMEDFGIPSAAIHGNKSQNNRNRALHAFRENKIGVLVATDIAARGIDIDGVTHVVNFDVTHEPETYVHRIGRTARAGASGNAISFCDKDERQNLVCIERLVKRKIAPVELPPLPVVPRSERSDDRDDDRGSERRPFQRTQGRPMREDRPMRDERPHRREAHGTAHDRAPRKDRPMREDRPQRDDRPVHSARPAAGKPSFAKPSFAKPSFAKPSFGKAPHARASHDGKPHARPAMRSSAEGGGHRPDRRDDRNVGHAPRPMNRDGAGSHRDARPATGFQGKRPVGGPAGARPHTPHGKPGLRPAHRSAASGPAMGHKKPGGVMHRKGAGKNPGRPHAHRAAH